MLFAYEFTATENVDAKISCLKMIFNVALKKIAMEKVKLNT